MYEELAKLMKEKKEFHDAFYEHAKRMSENIHFLLKEHEEELNFWNYLVEYFNQVYLTQKELEQALVKIKKICNCIPKKTNNCIKNRKDCE